MVYLFNLAVAIILNSGWELKMIHMATIFMLVTSYDIIFSDIQHVPRKQITLADLLSIWENSKNQQEKLNLLWSNAPCVNTDHHLQVCHHY